LPKKAILSTIPRKNLMTERVFDSGRPAILIGLLAILGGVLTFLLTAEFEPGTAWREAVDGTANSSGQSVTPLFSQTVFLAELDHRVSLPLRQSSYISAINKFRLLRIFLRSGIWSSQKERVYL
jgi:hypothetical protein